MHESTRRAPTVGAAIGWGMLFGYLCLLMLVVGVETALHFLGPPIDGPFQLYNALRRILAGQHAGVDFQFFHGLAIPYLHYLPFRLLGSNFIASEVTRQLMSALMYPLVIVLFLGFFLRDWTRVLAWSAIVMAGSIALRMTSMLVAVNSLLGIRSTIPTLLPIVLCLPVRRSVRVALTGIALGLALALGTEQGMAAALAIAIATAITAFRRRGRAEYIVDAIAELVIGVGILVVVLTAVGGADGMRGALLYNFRLVPLDQYWYFGTPPNLFLSSWSVVPAMLAVIPRIPITIAVGLVTVVMSARSMLKNADDVRQHERFAFTVLALYGLLSCTSLLGTYANAYIQPLLRVLLLLGAVHLSGYLPVRDERLGRRPVFGVGRSTTMTAVAALLLMIVVVPSVFVTTIVTLPHVIADHVVRRVGAVYSGIWPETLVKGQSIMDAHKTRTGTPPTLWSTYAGLLEARNGIFHPSFDYIIHALGPKNRAQYVSDFRRIEPDLVQTVSPAATGYESWIEGTSWDFYAQVLRNYRLIDSTRWSFFWERLPVPGDSASLVWAAAIAPGATSIVLPAAPGDSGFVLLQAELSYAIRNPLHVLPIVGALPRYMLFLDGAVRRDPISLDPYVRMSRVPVLAPRGTPVRLRWQTMSLLPGASITVTRVRLWVVPVSPDNAHWLRNLANAETRGDAAP